MSDLRSRLIRLAYQKPELRTHLLPVLRNDAPVPKARRAFSLRPVDKRVIEAFANKQPLSGQLLDTDGRSLHKMGMGSEKVAVWRGSMVVISSTESVKSDETILRYLIKQVGKRNVVFDYARAGHEKALTFTTGGDAVAMDQFNGWVVAHVPMSASEEFVSKLNPYQSKWGPDVAGVLRWSNYQGKFSIESVEVRPEFQRSGVASALYHKLFKDHNITARDLENGYQTDEGRALRRGLRGSLVQWRT